MLIKIKTFSGETLYISEEDYLDEVMYSGHNKRKRSTQARRNQAAKTRKRIAKAEEKDRKLALQRSLTGEGVRPKPASVVEEEARKRATLQRTLTGEGARPRVPSTPQPNVGFTPKTGGPSRLDLLNQETNLRANLTKPATEEVANNTGKNLFKRFYNNGKFTTTGKWATGIAAATAATGLGAYGIHKYKKYKDKVNENNIDRDTNA